MYMLYSCRSSSSSDESSTKLALCNTKTTSSSVSVALVEPCESVVFCLSLASWPDLCFCFVPNRPAKLKKQEIVNSKNFHFVSN